MPRLRTRCDAHHKKALCVGQDEEPGSAVSVRRATRNAEIDLGWLLAQRDVSTRSAVAASQFSSRPGASADPRSFVFWYRARASAMSGEIIQARLACAS
jgi:hypothetical protein